MKRRLLTLALATTMVFGLTACASKDKASGHTPIVDENEEAPVASDKISKIGDGVEFSFWSQIHPVTAESYKSLNEHPGAKLWEEATGVKVDYINPPVGEERKTLNLMLNDPSALPDAFSIAGFDTIYPGGVMMAIDDGIIMDITELVEKYAPNFMAMINSDENLKKDVYNDEGVMIGFGSVIVNEARRGGAMYGPIINKDYLDKAGLDMPETIQDWEEMLKAFKEMGVKYPLTFDVGYLKNCFGGAYGVPTGGGYFVDVNGDGKVHYAGLEDNYKEYLRTMNRWYEEGLIDPDYATRKLNQDVLPMVTKGDAGAYVGYVTQFKQLPTNAEAQGFGELNLVGAPYPKLNEGDQVHLRDYENNCTNLGVFITKNAKDPVSIIKWIDQMYTLEGRRINTFGEEGISYNIVDDVCTYTDLIINNPEKLSQAQAGRKYIFKDMFRTWEDDDHAQLYTEQSQYDAWDQWNVADIKGEVPRALTFTADEAEEFVRISSSLDSYTQEMQQKFIMGTADIDKEWDNFVNTLKGLECERAAELKTAAYERYLNR